MPTDGDRDTGARSSGVENAASSGTRQRVSPISGQNPGPSTIKIDCFDPKQQTFQRWLQRLERAF